MTASGFVRMTPRPSDVTVATLTKHRDALWRLRDYFLRVRSAGNVECEGMLDDGDGPDLPCPHQEVLDPGDAHGNYAEDTVRLTALEDAIELVELRLSNLRAAAIHERQIA